VVGIGASAGGIEALNRFFDAMPGNSGLAFVIVLHLDPTHASELAPIISRHTTMPVVEIADGMPIEANCAYVIAPDKSLTIDGDRLRLSEPAEPRGHRHPVDVLFASLADQRRERAIAIVLSGTGSNGTQGLKEIQASGGLTLAQDPDTARFNGMPRAAIAAGAADHVFAPDKLPEALLRYVGHGYMAAPDALDSRAPDSQLALDPVLAVLRTHSGHDFRNYKRSTLQRRIHRRMGLGGMPTLADYTDRLHTDPKEIRALISDLMISVSGFFRDREAWQALDDIVLAPLLTQQKADIELRLWVPACATGEEAYSLAMLAAERAESLRKPLSLKIFATDSQEDNLRIAREGIYPAAATTAIGPARLRRFFDALDGSYQVKKTLRELIVFAPQNLLRDPPFSHLDLITCRNLLIYLEPEAQKQVIALFHFALRQDGHLFLGNAETVGRTEDLFDTVSKKWRIYRRLGLTRQDIVSFPSLGASARLDQAQQPAKEEAPARALDLARRALLERYAPASVLIDQKGRILYFHGPTADYLVQPSGEPTRDLLAMAREGLRLGLRGALRQAAQSHQSVTFGAQVRDGKTVRPVSVTVVPLSSQPAAGLLLVSFEPAAEPTAPAQISPRRSKRAQRGDDAASRHALEEELRATRAELQSTIEQMDSAVEQQKAANEEITSVNEELQSTNEELETSKEELQSYNEELHTINNQLQHKIRELEDITDDQTNLLAGTETATLFLDGEYQIKWFSPASKDLLDLVPSDIGRPLRSFAPKFADPNLLPDAETVLTQLTRIESEVRSDEGKWYLRRLFPYRTKGNRIAGIVLTLTDITERKQATDAVNKGRLYAQAIVETIRQPLLVLDADLRVRSANRAFYALFQVEQEMTENKRVYELGNGQWDIPALRTLLEEVLAENKEVEDFRVDHLFEALGRRTMLVNARKLSRDGRRDLILLAIEDITVRSQAEAHRDVLIREMNHRVKNVLATVQAIASQTLRRSASLESFQDAYVGRLHALARAHDLLVDEGWANAEIGQLVRMTLRPYRGAQVEAEGPSLTVRPQAGVTLAMILHELATNAAKYGALSVPTGTVSITWASDNRDGQSQIQLNWIETGGPPVAPPSRRGFGSTLIERGTDNDMHGKAVLDYRAEGLRCTLRFPLEAARPRYTRED
jgi:two-component system CheB/CheR fusion protein